MKHDPREVREGLKELLALDGPPRDYLGARWIIRAAIELITTMQGDLRRQGFIEYQDKEESTE
jgi:hypothetical protein